MGQLDRAVDDQLAGAHVDEIAGAAMEILNQQARAIIAPVELEARLFQSPAEVLVAFLHLLSERDLELVQDRAEDLLPFWFPRTACDRRRGLPSATMVAFRAGWDSRTGRAPLVSGAQAVAASPPIRQSSAAISSTPFPCRRAAKMNFGLPRIRFASRSITARSAPTWGARSVLLMISRSDFVIAGPPLRGISSPAATSMT